MTDINPCGISLFSSFLRMSAGAFLLPPLYAPAVPALKAFRLIAFQVLSAAYPSPRFLCAE